MRLKRFFRSVIFLFFFLERLPLRMIISAASECGRIWFSRLPGWYAEGKKEPCRFCTVLHDYC